MIVGLELAIELIRLALMNKGSTLSVYYHHASSRRVMGVEVFVWFIAIRLVNWTL
jgi:uncharacterized Fe-S cluster-containing MiaB family protein